MRRVAPSQQGFTLIELMVTVTVIAILAVVAIPNLRDVVLNNRIRAGANEFVASLQSARMEAVRLNARAVVCRSTDRATCANSNGDWTSWVVLSDVDHDGAVDDLVRTSTANPALLIRSSAAIANGAITFWPDGMARTAAGVPLDANVGVCVSGSALPQNSRVVTIRTGSRFRTAAGNLSGCTAPSDP